MEIIVFDILQRAYDRTLQWYKSKNLWPWLLRLTLVLFLLGKGLRVSFGYRQGLIQDYLKDLFSFLEQLFNLELVFFLAFMVVILSLIMVFISGALMFAAYHAFLYVGELTATSAVAAVIVSLNPLLTSAFSRSLLPDEKLSIIGSIGILLGLLGIVIISRPDPSNLINENVIAKGLIFLAAASFALGSVIVKKVDANLPKETMISWAMLIGAVLMHLMSIYRSESVSFVWSTSAIIPVLYLSIVSGVFGFLIYFDLLERLGPIEINLVSYISPIFAALSGWIWLNETIDIFTVIGFIVIFAGFSLIKKEQLKEELSKIRRSI